MPIEWSSWIIGVALMYFAALGLTWQIVSGKLKEWKKECDDARTSIDKKQKSLVNNLDLKIKKVGRLVKEVLRFWGKKLPSSEIEYQERLMKGREHTKDLVKSTIDLSETTDQLKDLIFCSTEGETALKNLRKRLMIFMIAPAFFVLILILIIYNVQVIDISVIFLSGLVFLYIIPMPLSWALTPYHEFKAEQKILNDLSKSVT